MAVHYFTLWICFSSIIQVRGQDWTHHAVLDSDGEFQLFWTPSENHITFEIQVQTLGYVSIGFSTNGGMKGSDIVMGWINDDNGEVFLEDRFAESNSLPELDSSQDLTLLGGYQNDTHTVITFKRLWNTCDDVEDQLLNGDTTRLIWAYHETDWLQYHGSERRGVKSIYLREMPLLPVPVHEQDDVKIWDLVKPHKPPIALPNNDHTHYWCQIFKAPETEVKHHMIALRPLIHPGNEAYVHHMVLYECHVPDGDSSDWFDHHVNKSGEACYSPNMPPEWSFCLATNAWAWAVGSEGETLPDHVGMPLGEEHGGATYFMLETHYDNPGMHPDVKDSSGIRILYTDRVRQYDTAMLLVGSEVNFLHMIPPLQKSFKTTNRCSSSCTSNSLPEGGIQILNGVLHSHLASKKMRLRHVRNGEELPTILEDGNYDFNFQASRQPPEGRGRVLPGDELLLECTYDTSSRQHPTFGGLSTREEMCLGFILYYPRSPLADCRSLPTLETAMKAFGIDAIYGSAFEKLVAFMKDIDGKADGDTLQELLKTLASETSSSASDLGNSMMRATTSSPAVLSEKDLLNMPFYTVDAMASQPQNGLDDVLDGSSENYRTLLPNMLLNVRIKRPEELHNVTVGERFASLDWTNPRIGRRVQDAFLYGKHNSLCLAHGRVPLVPYSESPYPRFKPQPKKRDKYCYAKQLNKMEDDESVIPLDYYNYDSYQSSSHKIYSSLITVLILAFIS